MAWGGEARGLKRARVAFFFFFYLPPLAAGTSPGDTLAARSASQGRQARIARATAWTAGGACPGRANATAPHRWRRPAGKKKRGRSPPMGGRGRRRNALRTARPPPSPPPTPPHLPRTWVGHQPLRLLGGVRKEGETGRCRESREWANAPPFSSACAFLFLSPRVRPAVPSLHTLMMRLGRASMVAWCTLARGRGVWRERGRRA